MEGKEQATISRDELRQRMTEGITRDMCRGLTAAEADQLMTEVKPLMGTVIEIDLDLGEAYKDESGDLHETFFSAGPDLISALKKFGHARAQGEKLTQTTATAETYRGVNKGEPSYKHPWDPTSESVSQHCALTLADFITARGKGYVIATAETGKQSKSQSPWVVEIKLTPTPSTDPHPSPLQ